MTKTRKNAIVRHLIASITVLITGITGLGVGYLLSSHKREQAELAQQEAAAKVHLKNLEALMRLDRDIAAVRLAIVVHNDKMSDLDPSGDQNKWFVQEDQRLSGILYDKVEKYNALSAPLGCTYGETLTYIVGEDKFVLPCEQAH